MKKNFTVIFLLITVLCLCIAFSACAKGNEDIPLPPVVDKPIETGFTASFFSNNGSSTVTVAASVLTSDNCPTPQKSGYVFAGWYTDSAFSGSAIALPFTLTTDTSFYARWSEATGIKHTATFVTNGGTALSIIEAENIPSAPSSLKQGYQLEGWYIDSSLEGRASFPYTLSKDMVFYAKWTLNGLAWNADSETGNLIFMWPAESGAAYKIKLSNSESTNITVSNSVATFSCPSFAASTVTVEKNMGTGWSTLYQNNFKRLDPVDTGTITSATVNNDVVLNWTGNGSEYEIEQDGSIYTVNQKQFSVLLSGGQTSSFRIRPRQTSATLVYFAFWSQNLTLQKLASVPDNVLYYDVNNGKIGWSEVENAISYTIHFYIEEEVFHTISATPLIDAGGKPYTEADVRDIFAEKPFSDFTFSITANGGIQENIVYVSGEKSKKTSVAYIGAVSTSIDDAVLSWNALESAASYKLNITQGDSVIYSTDNTTSTSYAFPSGGTFDVSIKPNTKNVNSFGAPSQKQCSLLYAPVLSCTPRATGVTVMWDTISNATEYSVSVNDFESGEAVFSKNSYSNQLYLDETDCFNPGKYYVYVVAINSDGRFENSPKSRFAVQKLATPTLSKTYNEANGEVTLNITTSDDNVTFSVDRTKIASWYDENKDVTEGKTKSITFKPENKSENDISFSVSVYCTASSSAQLCIINSTTVKSEYSVLGYTPATDFRFASNDSIVWKKDEGVYFDALLDDKVPFAFEGLGKNSFSLSAELSSVPEPGLHTFKLRRRSIDGNAIMGDYRTLTFYKNPPALSLNVKDGILNWTIGQWQQTASGYIKGYSLWDKNLIVSGDLSGTSFSVFQDIINVEEREYKVIVRGDYTGGSANGTPSLNSEPSEAYKVYRLSAPVIDISSGIVTWKKDVNASGYTVFANDLVVETYDTSSLGEIGSFDANPALAGVRTLHVTAKGDDSTYFNSPNSNSLTVRKLTAPIAVKTDLDFDFRIAISDIDGFASAYEVVSDELSSVYTVTTDFGSYRFVPDSFGTAKAGDYSLKFRATGDGISTLTSEYSPTLTYKKLASPLVEAGDDKFSWQSVAAATSYSYAFNDSPDSTQEVALDFSLFHFNEGINTLTIRAKARGEVTSDIATAQKRKLVAPVVNIVFNEENSPKDYSFKWGQIAYAQDYPYTLNAQPSTTVSLTADFDSLDFVVGKNTFCITAAAEGCMTSDVTEFNITKLAAPVPVRNDTNFGWVGINNATAYRFALNNRILSSETTSASYKLSDFNAGENTFAVRAQAEGYLHSEYTPLTVNKLFAPVIEISSTTYSWAYIDNAQSYSYSLNGSAKLQSDAASVGYSLEDFIVGTNSFSVFAQAENYLPSETSVFQITKLDTPVVTRSNTNYNWAKITKAVDYEYTLNDVSGSTKEIYKNFVPLDYNVGDNTFTMRATAIGCLPSATVTLHATRLATPVATRTNTSYSWGSVENAQTYTCVLNKAITERTQLSANYELSQYTAGENNFSVVANAENCISSQPCELSVIRLAAPVLSRTAQTFSWHSVEGCTTYSYVLDNGMGKTEGSTSELSKTYALNQLTVGENIFELSATAEGMLPSTYTVLNVTRLSKPAVSRTGTEFTFSSNGASCYAYSINSATEVIIEQGAKNFALSAFQAGANTFSVKALSDSCFESDIQTISFNKLAAPNPTRTDTSFQWNAVIGATGYTYSLTSADITLVSNSVTDPDVSFTLAQFASGKNTFDLYATAEGFLPSDTVMLEINKLAVPKIIRNSTGYSWQAVEGASKYYYSLNGESADTTALSKIYSLEDFNVGNNKFELRADASDGSLSSETASNEVIKLAEPTINRNVTVFSWLAINGAESYAYSLTSALGTTSGSNSSTAKGYELSNFTPGENTFSLYATATDKLPSKTVSVKVNKLVAPVISRTNTSYNWTESAGATRYTYSLNGTNGNTEETSKAYELTNFTAGTNTFTVYASASGYLDSDTTSATVTKLATPAISAEGTTLSWAAINNATSYTYSLNGTLGNTAKLFNAYELTNFTAGANTFTVYASANGYLASATATLTVNKLATPVISRNDTTFSWATVNNAANYSYSLNGISGNTAKLFNAYELTDFSEGTNTFTVYASANGYLASATASLTVNKLATPTISVEDTTFNWTTVNNAASYTYNLNGISGISAALIKEYTLSDFNSGANTFTVFASANGYLNSATATITVNKLATPVISRKDTTFSWVSVNNASSYTYNLNGTSGTGAELLKAYELSIFNSGTNTFTVFASANGYLNSATATITVNKLATPVISRNNTTFSWATVNNASNYTYNLNGTSGSSSELIKAYVLSDFIAGTNTFTVYASANGYLNSATATITVNKLATPTLTRDDMTFNWGTANAQNYTYGLNGTSVTSTELLKAYELSDFIAGTNTFTVYASAGGYLNSATATITVNKLATPAISRDGTTFSWATVNNASSYTYNLNGTIGNTAERLMEYVLSDFIAGINTFTVYASASGYLDSATATITVNKLATPKITRNNTTFSWVSVNSATSYTYSLNGTISNTAELSKAYAFTDFIAGTNTFTVYASADGYLASATATLTVNKLATPTLTRDDMTFNWGTANAQNYTYGLNGTSVTSTELLKAYELSDFIADTNTFTVYASASGYLDSATATITVNKLATPVISRNNTTFSWVSVNNASNYTYNLNGISGSSSEQIKAYVLSDFIAGTNTFTVYASASGYLDSATATLTVTKLAAPVLSITENTLSWQAVEGATSYVVLNQDTQLYRGAELEYTIEGSYENLSVYAVGTTCLRSDATTIDIPNE